MTQFSLTRVQKKFPKIYSALTPEQQTVLKCLSVIYEKVARKNLISCLSQAGVKNKLGKAFVVKEINQLLKPLEKRGLVTASPQGIRCTRETVELVSQEAVSDKSFDGLAMAVQKIINVREAWSTSAWYKNYDQGIRDIRIAFYRGRNEQQLEKILSAVRNQFPEKYFKKHPFELLFFNPFNKEHLLELPPHVINDLILPKLDSGFLRLEPTGDLHLFLWEYCEYNNDWPVEFVSILALHGIGRGEIQKTLDLVEGCVPSSKIFSYRGWLALLMGKTNESLLLYRQGLELLKKETGKRKVSYANVAGIFYPVALLQSGDKENLKEGLAYLLHLKKQKNYVGHSMCGDLEQTFLFAMGQRSKASRIVHSLGRHGYYDYSSLLMAFLSLCWQGEEIPSEITGFLETTQEHADKNGYIWFAKEVTALLLAGDCASQKNQNLYDKYKKICPVPDLCLAIRPQENWEQVLTALTTLNKGVAGSTNVTGGERLVWLIDFNEEFGTCKIVPRLQKLSKSGTWTKGRSVALSTLCKKVNTLDYLSVQDKNVVGAIQKSYSSSYGYYGASSSYVVDHSQALPALVNHPLLFREDNLSVRVELIKGAPELHVLKRETGYEISLHPFVEEEESFALVQESPTRLKYIPVTQDYAQIADIIGESVTVPFRAKDKVLDALSQVAKVLTIHSDIGGASVDAKTVAADSRPYVHLLPYNEGLQVELLCRPFSSGGSYYRPGSGGTTVLAEVDGEQLQTKRDLQQEQSNADTVSLQCPTLNLIEGVDNEWIMEEPQDCLEFLCELQELGDEVVVEWPKGEKLQVTSPVSFGQFSMGIKRDNDWFGATGTLQVDEKLTLDMKKLLAMSFASKSRFIKLDDGRFLALSKAFRQRLEELRAYSEIHGDGVRFSPLAGLALEEFTEEVGSCKTDKHWKKNLKRFQIIKDPELPSTLQANLRDYQLEGFAWLARLSALQVGACLADDMGLGKTVQALSAILVRAPEGPTLVVAPLSVMMNWQDEATRFAPTLKVQYFANGNRQEILDALGSFDLVICSYGLLQSEAKMLSEVQWKTVVLDEAQAIKNMQTKRSKAAMQLQAEFKVITTGTPIENHLGELWNLFRFLNPGLLGSYESFKKKFSVPIEKLQDRTASNRLRKLIQPFILRRLKQDVLQELPSRTEVTMQVEMSAEESAMYEAQRIQALETLAEGGESTGGGQQHLQVLAEITRLRRFCCNPQLVVPDMGIASSKLKVFSTIVEELLENKHKALVFSQFVGHLALIRERLDSLGVSYQYLDGSTTTKQRVKRVNDFQAGKGDVFLISLKAGGSGLNLTAADYVIHMDPWWNPAVEDQASDRAHRIGQQRPVTIYRLVVKNTIEEKIVALHKNKRDLADNLLAGSDMSGKISTSELLKLLKSE